MVELLKEKTTTALNSTRVIATTILYLLAFYGMYTLIVTKGMKLLMILK